MNTATAFASSAPSVLSNKPAAPEKHFTPLVTQFLDYLRLEKHFSDYTVKSYGADLVQFGQFLAGEIGPQAAASPTTGAPPAKVADAEIDQRATACEPLVVREFLAYLYGQNYTKSTTARKLATLRSFYKFLIRRGIVAASPLSAIRTPKQDKRLPKCLDLDQVQKLLDAPGDADLLCARDKAMLEVLYSSGIRVSELVELEMGDLDLQEGVLRVKGKGRKDRLTPIGSQAIKALQRYFELRSMDSRSQATHQPRVFLNKLGESAVEFELVVVIASVETLPAVKSDLQLRILKAFRAKDIRVAAQLPAVPPPVVVSLDEALGAVEAAKLRGQTPPHS